MASYETHFLYAKGLQSKLLSADVLVELPEDCLDVPCGYTHRIFYDKCDPAEWQARQQYASSNSNDRRNWDPVEFISPDEMTWESRWMNNDLPAYYASRALPELVVIFTRYFDGAYDGGGYTKNGETFVFMPRIPNCNDAKVALVAAVEALKVANLESFAEEMVARYNAITEATEDASIERQRFWTILDYVRFENPDEYPDIE